MKIRIKGNPITPYGSFSHGDVLDDGKYPLEFLNHLVDAAGAADRIDYETKIDMEYEPLKKPRSSQSSPQVKASPSKTAKSRKKKQK